jgi:hypothetical protein
MNVLGLGLTVYFAGSRWGAVGLWIYLVERDMDEVLQAVKRGLVAAGISSVPTGRRPTRRYLGKAPLGFEMPRGVVWVAPSLGRGQL